MNAVGGPLPSVFCLCFLALLLIAMTGGGYCVKRQIRPDQTGPSRLWRPVAEALERQDFAAATAAKQAIEENQRQLLSRRTAAGGVGGSGSRASSPTAGHREPGHGGGRGTAAGTAAAARGHQPRFFRRVAAPAGGPWEGGGRWVLAAPPELAELDAAWERLREGGSSSAGAGGEEKEEEAAAALIAQEEALLDAWLMHGGPRDPGQASFWLARPPA